MSPRQWPEGRDRAASELRRALDDAQLRGPDDMLLRRGWTSLSALVERVVPARARRWPYFAGGVASAATLAVACAALLWPRTIEAPSSGEAARTVLVPSPPDAFGMRHLALEGGVQAQLDTASTIRLDEGEPRVESGEVRFSVPRRPTGHPFVVRAERYRVVVIGTRFGVAVDGERHVAINVREGVVEVWNEGARLARLHPGESWQSPKPATDTGTAPSGDDQAAAETPSEVASETVADHAAPTIAIRAAGADRGRRHGPARTIALLGPGGGGSRAGGRSEATPATADVATARAALAAGEPGRALQIYRALAKQTGPAAENAAYEAGKVLSERLGQPANAVAAWRRYRSDYPDGILRVEAEVSIIETLARMGESDDALTEATDFMRRHPDSERRAEIARVAGDLYRVRGDCRRAVSAYQSALAGARTRDVADSASFHRAECLVRMGDAGGVDAARGYLRSYPSGRFRTEAAALVSGDGRAR